VKSWILPLVFLATLTFARANNNMRDWKMTTGETHRAELVAYDEAKKTVTLRLENQREFQVGHADLSLLDQAWLLEWTEFGEEMQAKLEKIGGTLTRHTGTGKFTTEYSVYQPPLAEAEAASKPPLLILFHPDGNGHREILRYFEAAKAVGMTLVSCEYFRNSGNNAEIEAEMLERFTALLPQIEAAVPHDEKRMFMGGCSGGSWRSFHYSAQIQRPWAGVYSNCGWLGGQKWYYLPYPAMRVAMVNGNKDPAGSYHLEHDTVRLQEAGCKVSVHAFEGGHQVPPPSVQEKAFRWLLGSD
jgi:predicted esterase